MPIPSCKLELSSYFLHIAYHKNLSIFLVHFETYHLVNDYLPKVSVFTSVNWYTLKGIAARASEECLSLPMYEILKTFLSSSSGRRGKWVWTYDGRKEAIGLCCTYQSINPQSALWIQKNIIDSDPFFLAPNWVIIQALQPISDPSSSHLNPSIASYNFEIHAIMRCLY